MDWHPTTRAALWMSGALFSFIAMAVGAREVSGGLGTFEILFFRSLIGLAVLAVVLTHSGWHPVSTKKFSLHLARNLSHFGGQFGWFYGIAFIPLAEVFAIEFTVPVWTAILAALLLGEGITRARLLSIALGIAGVLLIVRPGASVVQPAAFAVLAGAVAFGLAHTLTRKLTRTDTPLAILFYMALIQLPFGLVPALWNWVTPSAAMWPWLVVVGLTALTAHYCMSRALSLAEASVVVPMDFLRLPLIALIGASFYGEQLQWYLVAGAALILVGNLIGIRAERYRKV
jgi:drug/metabolite transporter (DMT)-like permease